MIKCLLFDFDGVIAESVEVKTQAFEELFKDYPGKLREIIDYHMHNGGISRYIKIRHIYESILREPLTDETFQKLCGRFAELVKQKVIEAPYTPGALEVIKKCRRRYRMYIASGTPEDEMQDIVQKRRLSGYFNGVFGAPRNKAEIIDSILKKERLKISEIIFVGDSINDFEAAVKAGIRFAAKGNPADQSWLKDERIEIICADLKEFGRYLSLNADKPSFSLPCKDLI